MIIDTIREFFDVYDKIETRIKEIAPLCTNICLCEEITGFSRDSDGDICIRVWSQDCGNDAYYFPLQYLSMTNDEIVECEKKKAEEARKRAEREARKEARQKKKRRERQERREYERLKKKFEEGGANGR